VMYRIIRAVFPAWEKARLSILDEATGLTDETAKTLARPEQSSVPISTMQRLSALQCTANVAVCHAMILEWAARLGPVEPVPWPELTDDETYYLAMWLVKNPAYRAALVLHHGLDESTEDVQRMLGETWTTDARNAFFHRARQEFKSTFDWLRCAPSCGCPRTLCCCLTDTRFQTDSAEAIETTFGTLASSLYWLRKERAHVDR